MIIQGSDAHIEVCRVLPRVERARPGPAFTFPKNKAVRPAMVKAGQATRNGQRTKLQRLTSRIRLLREHLQAVERELACLASDITQLNSENTQLRALLRSPQGLRRYNKRTRRT